MGERDQHREIPDFARRGVTVGDYSIYEKLREASIEANWDYAQELRKLYRRADVMRERFMGTIQTPHFSGEIPPIVLAVDDLRNKNTLAAYRLVEDEYGLSFKITFNEVHYETKTENGEKVKRWRFGEWAQSETLLHEMFHHKQQLLGKDPYEPGAMVTHNKEFTDMLEAIGIHCSPEGYHYKVADIESPLGQLMKEWGIEPPPEKVRDKTFDVHWFKKGKERKGRSTLRKFVCPECNAPIRWGRKADPEIIHHPCSKEKGELVFFVDATEGTHQTLYDARQDNEG